MIATRKRLRRPTSEWFAELRDSLLQPPSPEHWEELLAYFHEWPTPADKAVGIAYAAEHLQSWPDSIRLLPYIQDTPYTSLAKGFRQEQKLVPRTINRLFSESSWMRDYKILDLSAYTVRGSLLKAIVESPFLTEVRELHIRVGDLSEKDWELLCDSALGKRLERLELSYRSNQLANSELNLLALLDKGEWTNLRHFAVRHLRFKHWEDLASHPALRKLESLEVTDSTLGWTEMEQLAELSDFERLKRLSLHNNRVCRESLLVLADCSGFAALEALDIGGNNVHWTRHPEALAQLQRVPWTRPTRDDYRLMSAGVFQWLNGSRSSSLKKLDLSEANLHELFLQGWELSELPVLRELEEVSFHRTYITDNGLSFLLQEPWSGLRSLDLSQCNLTSKGLLELLEKKPFPRLERLNLAHNSLSRESVEKLLSSVSFPALREVLLHRNKHTVGALNKVSLPGELKVRFVGLRGY